MQPKATRSVEQTVRAYVGLWNDRAYDDISDLVSTSFVMVESGAPGREVRGRDGLKSLVERYATGFPDFELTIDELVVGDGVAMFEGTFRGTHDGVFDGVAPTGRPVEIGYADALTVEDGRIQRERVYYDPREMSRQVGREND
ncbi:ester cyclase [Halogeometricum limi]|uniref:SnoaL-like polyketide cyclase n=1 Tax=Halogeometricum limi TaxID=555875 RepID=A0A1I6GLD4_9EURY|nr:ester cyclase [Halogeometricum limi]SFR43004.1 conserved hypothetical protein, steroid delta-isomerase-related [Halogeometricum limi]